MKRGLFILCLLFTMAGCDPSSPAPPPEFIGNGNVYLFPNKNGMGTVIFQNSLNEFLAQHPDARVVSIRFMDSPTAAGERYIVIVDFIPNYVATQPAPVPPVEK